MGILLIIMEDIMDIIMERGLLMPSPRPMLKPLLLLSLAIMAMVILLIIMEDIMVIITARGLLSLAMATTVMAMVTDMVTAMDMVIITARGLLSLAMGTTVMAMVMVMVTATDPMDMENKCIAKFAQEFCC